jgi:phosphoribosylformylglycinamidine synthase
VPPELDLDLELNVQRLTLAAIRRGLIQSAHDTSEGGLAVAIAESCIVGKIGASLELKPSMTSEKGVRLDAIMFGETQSRILVSTKAENLDALQKMAQTVGVPLTVLGNVGGDHLTIHLPGQQPRLLVSSSVNELEWAYRGALPRLMSK